MRYTLQKPVGQRIVSFKINGEEIVDTNIYHVATTTFLALGGDGFLAFKEGKMSVSAPEITCPMS